MKAQQQKPAPKGGLVCTTALMANLGWVRIHRPTCIASNRSWPRFLDWTRSNQRRLSSVHAVTRTRLGICLPTTSTVYGGRGCYHTDPGSTKTISRPDSTGNRTRTKSRPPDQGPLNDQSRRLRSRKILNLPRDRRFFNRCLLWGGGDWRQEMVDGWTVVISDGGCA